MAKLDIKNIVQRLGATSATKVEDMNPICFEEFCTARSEFEIIDNRDEEASNSTCACRSHVGSLLGHAEGAALNELEETWTVVALT